MNWRGRLLKRQSDQKKQRKGNCTDAEPALAHPRGQNTGGDKQTERGEKKKMFVTAARPTETLGQMECPKKKSIRGKTPVPKKCAQRRVRCL